MALAISFTLQAQNNELKGFYVGHTLNKSIKNMPTTYASYKASINVDLLKTGTIYEIMVFIRHLDDVEVKNVVDAIKVRYDVEFFINKEKSNGNSLVMIAVKGDIVYTILVVYSNEEFGIGFSVADINLYNIHDKEEESVKLKDM